jgi:hypothetical protein
MPHVNDAWERLERAGVPYGHGGPERPDLNDLAVVVAAVREVLSAPERLAPRQRVSLVAWLRAWASSFPTSFHRAFGAEAAEVLARAAEGVEDADRYLKLRRIAREKLLRVL